MSFADLAQSLLERKQQIDHARVNEIAEEIAHAYLKKLEQPDLRSLGTILHDGVSFSCIDYCAGMSVNEKRAVAALLTESPYEFKVDADFDYNSGNRIVISP